MRSMMKCVVGLALSLFVALSVAAPALVEHNPASPVFGEPSDITGREPETPREDEATQLWIKLGPSFTYDRVAVYFTTDGSTPSGALGVGLGSTQVLLNTGGQVNFVRNQPRAGGGNDDWWRANLPATTRQFGQTVRYRVSAWQTGENIERFAAFPGSTQAYSFTNKLAWPGRGAGNANPNAGYPAVSFWKEEGVTGNGFINTMLDQNGTLYDVYYPGAGGVNGVGTRNEGYSGGLDTFPAGLPLDHRGQMHINQIMIGLRVDGLTHWLSNPNGVSFTDVTQNYLPTSNTIVTGGRLTFGGNNITVGQVDFAPIGVTFPVAGSETQRSIHLKRILLTNNGPTPKTINLYAYSDWALNGGDVFDQAEVDTSRNVMVGIDRTYRVATGGGSNIIPPSEYNPTTFGGYEKNLSLALATGLKEVSSVGGGGGAWSTDRWSDTSGDQDRGWIGTRVTLQPGVTREFNMIVAGAYSRPAGNSSLYSQKLAPVMDWFLNANLTQLQNLTDAYWTNWLQEGVMVDLPDNRYDNLWTRSKLASALHVDTPSGSLIAGMHNGAYPYVWPRDMAYALITFARAGHLPEAARMVDWLRDTAFRGNEPWGKGFFFQKYTTDGYIIWSAPQVDETSCFPWALRYLYDVTGDDTLLTQNAVTMHESVLASTQDSVQDSRLYYDDSFNLIHGMNLWEDQFGFFNYTQASVIRALWDARDMALRLAQVQGNAPINWTARANDYSNRANLMLNGLNGRLAWGGENIDISLLGVTYPFEVIPANDSRATALLDRINGFAPHPTSGQFRPLVISGGEFNGLVTRYWGDSYWNGGPWWLSTLWFGLFHAERADFTPGKADIDINREKIDLLFPHLGPMGLGAEQIAASNSLVYPGFRLQTAYPNAWESMSTYMDAVMAFLDFDPDAATNTLRLAPKAPTGWKQMNFNGLRLRNNRFNAAYRETVGVNQLNITNRGGQAAGFDVRIKVPSISRATRVMVGTTAVPWTYDNASQQVRVQGQLRTGANAVTAIRVEYSRRTDVATPVSTFP